jgi:epoxide hydrolase 4
MGRAIHVLRGPAGDPDGAGQPTRISVCRMRRAFADDRERTCLGEVEEVIEHGFTHANGIRIHTVESGTGPPVLLLHGFPDFWYGWRHQIGALSDAGFRVIAPDLRGYNETDAPRGVRAYSMSTLVDDLVGLIGAIGLERPAVVGHDWGGLIGWHAAMYHPERVSRLAILNAPHPVPFARTLRRNPRQLVRSAYGAFFQLPIVPERLLGARRFALLRRGWRRGPAPQPEDVRRYMEAFRKPYRLSGPLNYYRAWLRSPRPEPRRIDLPTLVLWGERDPFLLSSLLEGLEAWVHDLRIHRVEKAGHWLNHDHTEVVNERLISFLRETQGS